MWEVYFHPAAISFRQAAVAAVKSAAAGNKLWLFGGIRPPFFLYLAVQVIIMMADGIIRLFGI
jgi:hypothetical protein